MKVARNKILSFALIEGDITMKAYLKTSLIIMILYNPSLSFAATDFTCMSNCQSKGYMYGYCQSACAYRNTPLNKNTDYQCMRNCQNKGYMYSYCQQTCSY